MRPYRSLHALNEINDITNISIFFTPFSKDAINKITTVTIIPVLVFDGLEKDHDQDLMGVNHHHITISIIGDNLSP